MSVLQLTTEKREERTERDFRYPICRSAIGQASCLIRARRRQLTFPFCWQISLFEISTRRDKLPVHKQVVTCSPRARSLKIRSTPAPGNGGQLRERLSEKICTRQSLKVIWDKYTVPDTVTAETTFVTFL